MIEYAHNKRVTILGGCGFEGTGRMVGLSHTGVPVLGQGFIIHLDSPVLVNGSVYECVVVFELFLEERVEEINSSDSFFTF